MFPLRDFIYLPSLLFLYYLFISSALTKAANLFPSNFNPVINFPSVELLIRYGAPTFICCFFCDCAAIILMLIAYNLIYYSNYYCFIAFIENIKWDSSLILLSSTFSKISRPSRFHNQPCLDIKPINPLFSAGCF